MDYGHEVPGADRRTGRRVARRGGTANLRLWTRSPRGSCRPHCADVPLRAPCPPDVCDTRTSSTRCSAGAPAAPGTSCASSRSRATPARARRPSEWTWVCPPSRWSAPPDPSPAAAGATGSRTRTSFGRLSASRRTRARPLSLVASAPLAPRLKPPKWAPCNATQSIMGSSLSADTPLTGIFVVVLCACALSQAGEGGCAAHRLARRRRPRL